MTKPQSRAEQRREAKRRRIEARERFLRARKATKVYARQLKGVAEQVGKIVEGLAPRGVVTNMPEIQQALEKYAELLQPWAKSVSNQMIAEVAQRDSTAWNALGREMGIELRKEIETAPLEQALKFLQDEQVELITSLPRKAAVRVHNLALEATISGTRAAETAKEIMRSGEVTASRAMLIARTETSRTVAAITATRAVHVGSPGYIWRTSMDGDVRELHRKLEGKFIEWDKPPVAGEDGERAHAGAIYNCRCYMEPILPDVIE